MKERKTEKQKKKKLSTCRSRAYYVSAGQKIKVFRKSILFCKYLRNESLDIYKILYGGQLLSCELKFEIL